MEGVEQVSRGVFALPNEILLSVFSSFPTPALVSFMPTCRQFHSLITRLLHHRLQVAAGLAGHTLYLECHHPSARWTAAKLFCSSLGTDGLEELVAGLSEPGDSIPGSGQARRSIADLYTRFRPQRKEPDYRAPVPALRHPAGDIPGSRTHPTSSAALQEAIARALEEEENVVCETVTVDAQDLFSQLTTSSYLGKRERTRGLLFSLQEVDEGTIRVWRTWLASQCESKSWTNGETLAVHHGTSKSARTVEIGEELEVNRKSNDCLYNPKRDPAILWTNTQDENVGLKFRVKERIIRRTNTPIMYSSDTDLPVSYRVEYAEVFVRTTHLLLKLEEAERQITNQTGKAIVFGHFSDSSVREVDSAGGELRF